MSTQIRGPHTAPLRPHRLDTSLRTIVDRLIADMRFDCFIDIISAVVRRDSKRRSLSLKTYRTYSLVPPATCRTVDNTNSAYFNNFILLLASLTISMNAIVVVSAFNDKVTNCRNFFIGTVHNLINALKSQ